MGCQGRGRRIEKSVQGSRTRYLYDQEDILSIFSGPTNCHTHLFLHGPGLDQPLAFLHDTNADCNPIRGSFGFREPIIDLLSDGLGSIVGLNSEATRLTERTTYDSFGRQGIERTPSDTPSEGIGKGANLGRTIFEKESQAA